VNVARARKEIGSDPSITQEQQQQERTQAMESPRSQRASKRKYGDSQEEDGVLDNPLDKLTEEESMMARAQKEIGSDPLITQEQQQQERTQAMASQRRKPKQISESNWNTAIFLSEEKHLSRGLLRKNIYQKGKRN
jgi:hypothetical protein